MSDLRSAAQAVLDRWDSPKWEWAKQGPTAALMSDLRKALAEQKSGKYFCLVCNSQEMVRAKFDEESG